VGASCEIRAWRIFPGDEVFLYGRLVTHDGQQRNKPVVRFGNISMFPDSESPVKIDALALENAAIKDVLHRKL
jgi:hypothetical protein